jgi:phospholipase/carboxylesterase
MARLFNRVFSRRSKGDDGRRDGRPEGRAPERVEPRMEPRARPAAAARLPKPEAEPRAPDPSPPVAQVPEPAATEPPAAAATPPPAELRPSQPPPAPAPIKRLTAIRWGPERGDSVDMIVFMCHGMASSAKGIIQIAPQLGAVVKGALFVAPNGPDSAEAGGDARAWFDPRDRSPRALEAGVRAAAAALNDLIDDELEKACLPPDAYALAGYSQGAMTALFTGLRRDPGPRAILCYAGALIAPHKLAEEIATRPPVMLVHGLADPVVPAFYSRDAEKALRALRVPVQGVYVPRLGHSIDQPALQAGKQFLRRWLLPGAPERPRTRLSAADG